MSKSTYANVLKTFAVSVLLGGGGFMEQAISQGLPRPQNSPGGSFGGNRDARQEARRAIEAQLGGTSGSGSGASSISRGANTGASGPSFAVQPGFVQQGTTPQNSAGLNSGATMAGNAGPLFQNRPGVAGMQASERAAAGVFGMAGMRAGDNLLSINGHAIQNEAQLLQVLRSLGSANQPVNVVISRGGAQQTISLQPGAVTQALGALQQGLAGTASAQGIETASNTSPSPALGPTGANTNGTAQSTTPASPSQPTLTSGIIRGPSATGPSSSIQGVGADLQNFAITPPGTTTTTSGGVTGTGGTMGVLTSVSGGGTTTSGTTGAGVNNSTGTPALGPTGSSINNSAEATTLATPIAPSLTSGITRGPSVTSPSSSIQGVGADLQNPAIAPSTTTGVNSSNSIATTGSATFTNGTVTTGTGTGAARTGDTSVTNGTAVGVPATAPAGTSSGTTPGANPSKRPQGGIGPGMQSLQVPGGPSLPPGIGQPLPGTVANPATLASPNAGIGNSASGSSAASSDATTGEGNTNPIQGLATGTPSSQGTINSSVQGGFSGAANPGAGTGGPGKGPAGAQGKAGVRGGATGGNAAGKGVGGGGAGGSGGGGPGGGGGAGGGGAGAGGT